MNKSLVRRLERLESGPVSHDALHRVRTEWRRTGVVPDAPPNALRLACFAEAGVAEMEASVPRSGDADAEERRRELLLNYAGEVRELRRNPRAWVGREFILQTPDEHGCGLEPWGDRWSDAS